MRLCVFALESSFNLMIHSFLFGSQVIDTMVTIRVVDCMSWRYSAGVAGILPSGNVGLNANLEVVSHW